MRNLYVVAKSCMNQLDSIGIPYRAASFEVNSRAVKRWGQCSCENGKFIIQISSVLLNEKNSEYGLRQTIIHELIHTCCGCMNHGEEWQKWADKCNRCLGYKISRCNTAESLGVVYNEIKENKPYYLIVCKNCGHRYVYYRYCKVVKNPNLFRCGCCKGSLEVSFDV